MGGARAEESAQTPLGLVRLATGYLGRRGASSPRLDAEVLLAHVLGVPRIQIYLDFEKPLEPRETDAYRTALRRRGAGEPVAYITGKKEFWSLELAVDPRVLVPRPDTETLVGACLPLMGLSGRLLDLGVGSGAVALALLAERPGWNAVGVDRSGGAVEVAAQNARALGLEDRLELRRGDLFDPVRGERFDLVVSNPPYIITTDIDRLEGSVSRFEPRVALDGGADGLGVLRRIARQAGDHLPTGGVVATEIGIGQGPAVCSLFEAAGLFGDVRTVRDHGGRFRVVTAARG